MNISLVRVMNNCFLGILLVFVSTNLEANVKHPKGPEGNEWNTRTLQIRGAEKDFTLSFSAPAGNDPRVKDKIVSETATDDPRFEEGGPSGPIRMNWCWGHDWFWQDYHGFLDVTVQINTWKSDDHGSVIDGFEKFISQKINNDNDKKRNRTPSPGAVSYVFEGGPARKIINGAEWLSYNVVRLPSVIKISNNHYVFPLDNRHYLLIYFNFIDQTKGPGIESDWIPRAKAMTDKIMNSVKITTSTPVSH